MFWRKKKRAASTELTRLDAAIARVENLYGVRAFSELVRERDELRKMLRAAERNQQRLAADNYRIVLGYGCRRCMRKAAKRIYSAKPDVSDPAYDAAVKAELAEDQRRGIA